MKRGYVTIKQAAEILGISPATLRVWDVAGKLKAYHEENGYRLYRIRNLERFAQKNDLRRSGQKRRLVP